MMNHVCLRRSFKSTWVSHNAVPLAMQDMTTGQTVSLAQFLDVLHHGQVSLVMNRPTARTYKPPEEALPKSATGRK